MKIYIKKCIQITNTTKGHFEDFNLWKFIKPKFLHTYYINVKKTKMESFEQDYYKYM